MAIKESDVENIAQLAKLALTPNEIKKYAEQMSTILEFIEQMNKVDTSAIEPLAHPLDSPQRLRQDKVTEINERKAYQTIAPKIEAGFYVVPKVIE